MLINMLGLPLISTWSISGVSVGQCIIAVSVDQLICIDQHSLVSTLDQSLTKISTECQLTCWLSIDQVTIEGQTRAHRSILINWSRPVNCMHDPQTLKFPKIDSLIYALSLVINKFVTGSTFTWKLNCVYILINWDHEVCFCEESTTVHLQLANGYPR